MTYNNIHSGIFLRRSNRFVAEVEINGKVELCHVKNTGRCAELLLHGTNVCINKSGNLNRATAYDLVVVYKGGRLVNIDSTAPNKAFLRHLQEKNFVPEATLIKPEAKHGGSRFDFYVEAGERKILIEVKGVTLENDGIALFPDAPTQRGVRHVEHLARVVLDGYEAYVVFIIQMAQIQHFEPNYAMHKEFGAALEKAYNAGVKIHAFDCEVTPNAMKISSSVPVILGGHDEN